MRPGWQRLTVGYARWRRRRSPSPDGRRRSLPRRMGGMTTSAACPSRGLTKRYGRRTAVDQLDLELPSGRRRRLHRAERRRQDHDDGHAARPRPPHGRRRHGARRPDRRPRRVPPSGRGADREPGLLPVADRAPRTCGCSPRSAATTRPRSRTLLDDRRPRRARRRPLPQLLARHEAAARHRRRAARRPRAADPRRARQRPRPARRPRDARADRRAGRHRSHGARVVPRPQRARAGVRLARADRRRPIALPGPDPRRCSTERYGGIAVAPEHPADRAARCGRCSSRHGPRGRAATTTASSSRRRRTTPTPSPPSINRAAFDAGIVLVELSPLRTTLEDRYLAMVQGGAR